AAGELRGHLLHVRVPVARLGIETLQRLVDPGPAAVGVARPPVDRVLPGLRAGLPGPGCRPAQGIAPGRPVLARQALEILYLPVRARAPSLVQHAVLLVRNDHSTGPRPPSDHRTLRTSGSGSSC